MSNQQLVLSIFPNEVEADKATMALKDSGITMGDAIGILALDGEGHLKQEKVGSRSTTKGAAIGGLLTLLGPVGLGAGLVGGAAAGALHHKNLGLSDGDKAALTDELQAGKAAVGVLASYETAPAISERLGQLGGTSQAHDLSDEAIEASARPAG
jgi:uncharacterized membrane protein